MTEIDHGFRVIPCRECGGDGGWHVLTGVNREEWVGCKACDSTGNEEITVEPVTMEDMEHG